jgi:hypothetical protein
MLDKPAATEHLRAASELAAQIGVRIDARVS